MRKKDFSKNSSFFSNVEEKIQSIRLCDVKTGYTPKKKNLHTPWKIYIKRRRLLFLLLLPLVVLLRLLRLQFYGHFERCDGGSSYFSFLLLFLFRGPELELQIHLWKCGYMHIEEPSRWHPPKRSFIMGKKEERKIELLEGENASERERDEKRMT